MIEKILKYKHIIFRRSFTLIDVVFGDANRYNVLFVNKKGDELFIDDCVLDLDFETLSKKINKNSPILLHFSGKGIISKKLSSKSNYLKEILFNSPPLDFYIYELNHNNINFVSVVRRDLANRVFNDFSKEGFIIIDYSLGPFIGALYKNISKEASYFSQNYLLNFKDEELIDFEESKAIGTKTYALGDEVINNNQIPLFSSLINCLYPNENVNYDNSFLRSNTLELKRKRIFNILGISILVFFLTSLISSFMIINYYNDKYLSYEEQLYYLNDTFADVKKLESDIIDKKAIINESGVLSKQFISFYLFEIGKSVPEDVIISELDFNPIIKKIKEGEPLKIKKQVMEISGISESSKTMNDWVKKLKNIDWIEHIEITNFSKNRKNDLEFELEITYK